MGLTSYQYVKLLNIGTAIFFFFINIISIMVSQKIGLKRYRSVMVPKKKSIAVPIFNSSLPIAEVLRFHHHI